jgi:hypothetical protein
LSATGAAIVAATEILAATVASTARRIILRGVVMRRKILRSGGIGFRLAFVACIAVNIHVMLRGERVEGWRLFR